MLYESLNTTESHFSDRDNALLDTFEYAEYSLSTEKLKIAFRVCYALFDKIGYVINSYFNLGISLKKVNFRSIWSSPNNNQIIHPVIAQKKNWPLRGLFWISKDLSDKESEFTKALLPEAQQIAAIRNFMEHKSFKIVTYGETKVSDDLMTFTISRMDLEDKVMTVVKMARSAIMYLASAIHVEEQMKEKPEYTLQIPFTNLPFEEKI